MSRSISKTARITRAVVVGLSSIAFALVPASAQLSPTEGAVYTSTNSVDGNKVMVFHRAVDGTATFQQSIATGGIGTGATLSNQGAVTLSDDERWLFVVNAGSNDLSVFRVLEDGLELTDIAATQGLTPVSVAQHDELVYVVNAGDDSVYGFRLRFDGQLVPIHGGRAYLANSGSGAAQIGFGPNGRYLYVTGRDTQSIDGFRLNAKGTIVQQGVLSSNGAVPFGFAVGNRGQLFVSEGGGGIDGTGAVTSYRFESTGALTTISPSVDTTRSATCWVVLDPTRRLMFVSNTGSNSISSLAIGFDGELTLLDPDSATTGAGPLDMAITADGEFFYVLNEGVGEIGDYTIDADGSLFGIPGSPGGIPAGASGLAAR